MPSDEILIGIFSYLPISAVAKAMKVCKRWERVLNDNMLWYHHYVQRWTLTEKQPFQNSPLDQSSNRKRKRPQYEKSLVEDYSLSDSDADLLELELVNLDLLQKSKNNHVYAKQDWKTNFKERCKDELQHELSLKYAKMLKIQEEVAQLLHKKRKYQLLRNDVDSKLKKLNVSLQQQVALKQQELTKASLESAWLPSGCKEAIQMRSDLSSPPTKRLSEVEITNLKTNKRSCETLAAVFAESLKNIDTSLEAKKEKMQTSMEEHKAVSNQLRAFCV